MRHSRGKVFGQGKTVSGFSLIELLTVIAIIAIITAILLPVFASVREGGRQKTAMENLHTISVGISQFELDNHRAPEVLFAYANGGGPSMDSPYSGNGPRLGLFPQYVKDPDVFTDPDNPVTDHTLTTTASVLTIDPATSKLAAGGSKSFYTADAYDISPQIASNNVLNNTTYVPRYQLSWTSITGAVPPGTLPKQDYDRQMRFPNAPGETYVTCTTYHVPKGKVIVLWENGGTKTIDTSRFLQNGADVASLAVNADVSNANFWKVTP